MNLYQSLMFFSYLLECEECITWSVHNGWHHHRFPPRSPHHCRRCLEHHQAQPEQQQEWRGQRHGGHQRHRQHGPRPDQHRPREQDGGQGPASQSSKELQVTDILTTIWWTCPCSVTEAEEEVQCPWELPELGVQVLQNPFLMIVINDLYGKTENWILEKLILLKILYSINVQWTLNKILLLCC